MNKTLKYILLGLCATALVVCIGCSFAAGKKGRNAVKCDHLEICIRDSMTNSFINKADVKKYLDRGYGVYIGVALDSIDLTKIEKCVYYQSRCSARHRTVPKPNSKPIRDA